LVHALRQWSGARVRAWRPEERDAGLYAASALFAGLTPHFSGLALYRQWGELAVGPYLVAAVASALVGRHRARKERLGLEPAPPSGPEALRQPWRPVRIVIFLFVLVGATLGPLSLEVAWRAHGNPAAHVQPEDTVINQHAHLLVVGQDPYRLPVHDGRVVAAVPGQPVYESFFPYLPLMMVFGLPSSAKVPEQLTDPRIFFSIVTLLVVFGALAMYRGPTEPRVRTLQVLTVLPTAALPLATGGDDMPVVALLLLAMVLAQRRRPGWSGFVLGIVSAMKFTAWPLALLALFAARTADGRRAPGRMALGMLVVGGPVIVPFLLHNPHDFIENVVLFPLGLAGVASPAASPLPGHLIVSAFPALHRLLPITVAAVGGVVLVRHLVRHPPTTTAQACSLAGWIMTVAILFAPATRVGYVLYPINFFVWAHMLRQADEVEVPDRLAAAQVSAALD